MRIEILNLDSLGAIAALHRQIVETLPDRSFLYPRGRDFFEAIIAADGAVVGAFADSGELVAYAAVVKPGVSFGGCPRNLGPLAIDAADVSFAAGCGVHPAYRREGLMTRIIAERTRLAAALGARFVTVVVAPQNRASLVALHGLGHAAVGVHRDEDGDNYLLLRATVGEFPRPADAARQVALSDPAGNLAVLREGRLIGLPVQGSSGPWFTYVEPDRVFASQS